MNRPLATLAALALLALAPAAGAQQGYGPTSPPPPPPTHGPPHGPPSYGPPLGAPVAPPARVARTGFVLGGGIGIGSLDLEGPRASSGDLGSIFFHAHAGGMLSPRLALLVELWGSDHRTDRCSLDPDQLCTFFFEPRGNVAQGNVGISAQYWLTPRFWLKAGFGTSRLSFRRDSRGEVEVARGGAFLAALGYELLHERYYALDLALRFTAAGYGDEPLFGEFDRASSGALALSFSWY